MSKSNEKDKTRNGGQWTEARFRGFVTAALRGAMRRWPPKWEALKAADAGKKINKKTKRLSSHYRCRACGGEFAKAGVQVDHINPIGHCDSWDQFIERLFCELDNLQVLCKKCHKAKTKEEKQKE